MARAKSSSTTKLSAPKFKVGDVCILLTSRFEWLIGKEVTIMSPLEYHHIASQKNRYLGYLIDVAVDGGYELVARESHLKKKPLPGDFSETTSWDSVGWNPYAEKVLARAAK